MLALFGCGSSDRNGASSTQSGSASIGYAGPQSLVLRVPRNGGPPKVIGYPRVDSTVWGSTDPAPAAARVLAFDEESGSVAYEDSKGRPVLLELRLGTITVASSRKLSGLASANGKAVFGIAENGNVVRMTPTGDWTFKPPQPASLVFPQPEGGLLVAVGRGANTHLLKIFPPDSRVIEDIPFPAATRTVRTQLGDRLYLAVDSGLIVLRTRSMDWGPAVKFTEPIAVMASTPSGDRIFVLTESRNQISVVDRYREAITARFELPGKADDLRIDPFGRYLLARAADKDSIWIVAIGTERVTGGVRGAWRDDLPFVGHDGAVAVASGTDVILYDGETLKPKSRVRGGASDYWYPFLWDGFRPRAASLDVPVRFDSVAVDSTAADSTAVPDSTGAPSPGGGAVADTAAERGFIVSFAAFLIEDRAKELAGRIRVGGENARVITTSRDNTTIYRVVLGPYLSRDEADRAGRESGQAYWVYEGVP
jgi:hypothetical protein